MVVSGSRRDFDDRSDFTGDRPIAQTGVFLASDRFRAITCSRRSSPGVADSRSPQSVAEGPARVACQFCSLRRSDGRLAVDPNAGWPCYPGSLRRGTAFQRGAPPSRAFYWRGVLNRQYLMDLDDYGRSELPVVGRPVSNRKLAAPPWSGGNSVKSPSRHFLKKRFNPSSTV